MAAGWPPPTPPAIRAQNNTPPHQKNAGRRAGPRFATPTCELQWLHYFLTGICIQCECQFVLYCDSQSALHIAVRCFMSTPSTWRSSMSHCEGEIHYWPYICAYFPFQVKSKQQTFLPRVFILLLSIVFYPSSDWQSFTNH